MWCSNTNPRGSSGYGSSFGNEIKNAYPGKDLDDLMAGVDEIISRGYIDDRNLFVYGGSGGGVLTSWIVGNTDRFTAAVVKAPVTNWLSFVGTTDGASWYRNFEKLPWEDPEEHLRRSTLMYVGNVTTPTMLMTGGTRPAHPHGADRAVLPGAQDAEDSDGDGAADRRLAQPQPSPDELPAGAAPPPQLVRAVRGRRRDDH